jgi:transcriptional regulator with XRE-family HTH domain
VSNEIGQFLQARRARIAPEDRGFPSSGRRRVAGLRREELALLAGVSTDYYVRVEQGRADAVSDSVLAAIARVLDLDDTELAHLTHLARPPRASERPRDGQEEIRPGIHALAVAVTDVPVFVVGRCQQVVFANPLGEVLLPEGLHRLGRNAVRQVFLDPAARTYYVDWAEVAADTVASLRLESGRHPGDRRVAGLVGELVVASAEFEQLWAQQAVQGKSHGQKRLRHPSVGVLVVDYETLTLPDDPDTFLVTYTPHDRATADALAMLNALNLPAPGSAELPGDVSR